MTANETALWTQQLIPKLAEPLQETGPWLRVEESRKGGWNCLHGDSGENATSWYHLSEKGQLKELHPLEDRRLPVKPTFINQWISSGVSVELLAWGVGSRTIFRLGNDCIAKVFRNNRQVIDRWKYLSAGSAARSISIPSVVNWDPKQLVLTVKEAAGDSLNSLWKSGQWDQSHLHGILKILSWLSESKVSEILPSHTADDEIDILDKRNQVFHRILRSPSKGVKPLVIEVIHRLKNLSKIDPVICHRDFHDKQVLIAEDEITLLDLDLLALADPCLDAGNIIAHLRLRALQGLPVPWLECTKSIAESLANQNLPGERLQTWTASTFARLLLIYSRRQRPSDLLNKLESDLNELLDGTGNWQGVFK